jgi:AcrR family transcriptional regulator
MAGLRERKKHATRKAIHEAGLRLFAEQGFAATTMEQIAGAADVSRATVFTYYAAKEDVVFGDAPLAIAMLAEQLAGTAATIKAVREWLRPLTGWMEPDLLVQRRLAREIPAVAARRAQLFRAVEDIVARALENEFGPERRMSARLAAGALVAALGVAEDAAAERIEHDGRPLADEEVDAILDAAVAFAEAGLAALPDEVARR